jgi:hypothetical protein
MRINLPEATADLLHQQGLCSMWAGQTTSTLSAQIAVPVGELDAMPDPLVAGVASILALDRVELRA